MPVKANSAIGETPYSVEGNVWSIIIPLPSKVFITAEHAEKLAFDLLSHYQNVWDDHKTHHGKILGSSADVGDNFVAAIGRNEVLARTYLTYGWKHKSRILNNIVATDFKNMLLYHEFPRYIWVTEFGTLSSLNHVESIPRRIFGHVVVDATASIYWQAQSMFHAPGFGIRWFHDPANVFGDYKEAVSPIADDRPYYEATD